MNNNDSTNVFEENEFEKQANKDMLEICQIGKQLGKDILKFTWLVTKLSLKEMAHDAASIANWATNKKK